MAESPSHKFGQIIGELLEAALYEPLQKIAREHKLYLDYKHLRPARGGMRKVAWTDSKGNQHDLDYVLEEGGSEQKIGRPRAFIETAWRRYTKHSRNKAQEIQGAIIPLAETYSDCRPFLGVVLAGVFTAGSLAQLRSHGFNIVYCSYESMVKLFRKFGIDAHFGEQTTDAELQAKVDAFRALNDADKARMIAELRRIHRNDLRKFFDALRATLTRAIKLIFVLPLHGTPSELTSLADAVRFLEKYAESSAKHGFVRYELQVRYTNGDEVRAQFAQKAEAIKFLQSLT